MTTTLQPGFKPLNPCIDQQLLIWLDVGVIIAFRWSVNHQRSWHRASYTLLTNSTDHSVVPC